MPAKVRSIHGIVPSHSGSFFITMMPVIKYLLGKALRLRVILHSGKCDRRLSQEFQDEFGMRGLELDSLVKERYRQELFATWLEQQQAWEERHIMNLLHPLHEEHQDES